ncbi:uncharacterized protein LOC105186652, partial [Harpegnathos saltator]|uniref:uncharacterized protein LOC105186652 n=1 Tax=Harpegnathos saltator TaxID=610380 RepID=UPI00058D07DC
MRSKLLKFVPQFFCQLKVHYNSGNERVRLLLDSDSELTVVAEELVHRLHLNRRTASIPLIGIGAGCTIQAHILPRLTRKLPSIDVSKQFWPHLQKLQLADPDFGIPRPVQILIGADYHGEIIKSRIIRGEINSPIAQLTIFGWVLFGPASPSDTSSPSSAIGSQCSRDHNLEELLTRFWIQEELPQREQHALKLCDTSCEMHFQATHSRDKTGRFVVRLPLKSSASALGNSTTPALRCLSRINRCFCTDSSYKRRYTEFIQEYEALGHMKLVFPEEIGNKPACYLPHHGVLREQNRTTKLRVVFNGSSPTSSGLSLNDILYSGPKLPDITQVLLWIRKFQYIFGTDIIKMLTTVTYGLNCAPYLALRCLQQLIKDEGNRFPLAIPAMPKDRYIDDIFGGAESINELQKIVLQLIAICKAGGFSLQKWSSNNLNVFANMPKILEKITSTVELESSQ